MARERILKAIEGVRARYDDWRTPIADYGAVSGEVEEFQHMLVADAVDADRLADTILSYPKLLVPYLRCAEDAKFDDGLVDFTWGQGVAFEGLCKRLQCDGVYFGRDLLHDALHPLLRDLTVQRDADRSQQQLDQFYAESGLHGPEVAMSPVSTSITNEVQAIADAYVLSRWGRSLPPFFQRSYLLTYQALVSRNGYRSLVNQGTQELTGDVAHVYHWAMTSQVSTQEISFSRESMLKNEQIARDELLTWATYLAKYYGHPAAVIPALGWLNGSDEDVQEVSGLMKEYFTQGDLAKRVWQFLDVGGRVIFPVASAYVHGLAGAPFGGDDLWPEYVDFVYRPGVGVEIDMDAGALQVDGVDVVNRDVWEATKLLVPDGDLWREYRTAYFPYNVHNVRGTMDLVGKQGFANNSESREKIIASMIIPEEG